MTASIPLTGTVATLVASMSESLDQRIGFPLPIVIAGALLASGRRTAASWFCCGGVNDDWGGHWTFVIDDSPTRRFGRCVEAANIHHNPTPGPGDGDWLYGHN